MRNSKESSKIGNSHQIVHHIRWLSKVCAGFNIEVSLNPKNDRLKIVFDSDEHMAEFFRATCLDLEIVSTVRLAIGNPECASMPGIQINCNIKSYSNLISSLYDAEWCLQ